MTASTCAATLEGIITLFDMVVLSKMSRLHLCLDVMRYAPGVLTDGSALIADCTGVPDKHEHHIRERLDDLREIENRGWSEQSTA